MQIYIHRNNQQLGPFTEADVRAQLASGALSLQDHVWWQGQANWVPLAQSPFATPLAPGIASAIHPPQVDRTSGLAIGSLISGILGFFCGIPALIAIVLGHLALSEIKKDPAVKGRGLALAGLITGYAVVILGIVYLAAMAVLVALGSHVKTTFTQITQQLEPAQSTSSDSSTNSSDPSATTNSDQGSSTNSADTSTNAPDINAAPATNSPDSTTNSPPATKQQ